MKRELVQPLLGYIAHLSHYLASSIPLGNSHWLTFYRVASYGTTSHGTTSDWIASYEFHRSISSGADSLVKANLRWYNFLLDSQTMFSHFVQTQLQACTWLPRFGLWSPKCRTGQRQLPHNPLAGAGA